MGLFGKIAGSLLDFGTNLIGAKYQSDLQGHENDRMRSYNLDMAREMFDKQVQENKRVFGENVEENKRIFGVNVAREDQVWDREKAYNLDLWNRANEYNSPVSQMQRLKDAGLNPNLMYGQGTTGIATAISPARTSPSEAGAALLESARTTVPEYGAPNPKGEFLGQALGRYVSIRNANLAAQNMSVHADLIRAQRERQEAERKAVEARVEKTREEIRGLRRENDLLGGAGVSGRDPWYLRLGGRLGKFFRSAVTGQPYSSEESLRRPISLPWKVIKD